MKDKFYKIHISPYIIFTFIVFIVTALCKYIYLAKYTEGYARILLLEWNMTENILGSRFNIIFISQFCISQYLMMAILSQQFVWINNHFYMIRHYSMHRYINALIKSTLFKIVLMNILTYICIWICCGLWDNLIIIFLNLIKQSLMTLIFCLIYYVLYIIYKKNMPIYMILPVIVILLDTILRTSMLAYSIEIYYVLLDVIIYIIICLLFLYIIHKKSKFAYWR